MERTDPPKSLTNQELKDLCLLARFIACWCQEQHDTVSRQPLETDAELPGHLLCSDCRELLAYAIARRRACPLDPKPACKDCPIHCYQPERRNEIRKIMRFSGRHLILRGRLNLLWHYFF